MKRVVAGVVTVAILAGVVWFSQRSQNESPEAQAQTADEPAPSRSSEDSGPEPQDCIQRMFVAAEQGNIEDYLDCFSGQERERLQQQLDGQPPDQFAAALVQAIQPLKGHAVHEAKIQGNQAQLLVERVYASRNERQRYILVRDSDQWRITAVHSAG